MSLRARVLLGFAVVAIVLMAASVAVVKLTRDNLTNQVDEQLAGLVRMPGVARGPDSGPPGGGPAEPDNRDSTSRPTPLWAGYLEADGGLSTAITPDFAGGTSQQPAIDAGTARAAASSGEPFTTDSSGSGGRFRVRATLDARGGGVALVALPLASVDDSVNRLLLVEGLATATILGVLALVAWWVIRLGVRPVNEMAHAASSIAAGDLSRRVPESDPRTEVGELGGALNSMLERLESAFGAQRAGEERLRRFLADASHELRTPVTTIRGYAELYRAGGLEAPGELDEAMRRTEAEAERMGALVGDMLQLARLDEGRPLEWSGVDLAALVADAASDARAVAPGRTVDVSTEGSVVVTGDRDRLRQVVGNLVANALVHTDGPVHLSAGWDPAAEAPAIASRTALLVVSDEGPGMEPLAAARAFERFYRPDASRSRRSAGSGLGLSIVQSVVAAHGGVVDLTTSPDSGTVVELRLPEDRPVREDRDERDPR